MHVYINANKIVVGIGNQNSLSMSLTKFFLAIASDVQLLLLLTGLRKSTKGNVINPATEAERSMHAL